MESHQIFDGPITDEDVANYLADHVNYRNKIKAFWEAARQAPSSTKTMDMSGFRLLRRFDMGDDAFKDGWSEHGAQLLGVAQRQAVEELFAPHSYADQERQNRQKKASVRRGGGPGQRRLFRGVGWEELLVIPYSDLPGRIIAFAFIGKEGSDQSVVFKRANIGCSNLQPRESGIGFLPAIDGSPHHLFGNRAFVFLDPTVATLLHARHFRSSARPLPILLAKFSRNFRTQNLPPDVAERTLIFCGPLLKVLPLAKAHNGLVSLYEIPPSEVRDNLKRRESHEFLHLFASKAIPWVSALKHALLNGDRAELDVLLARLQLTPRESLQLVGGLGGEASARFASLDPNLANGRTIESRGFSVRETPQGWTAFRASKQQLICNRPIRIEAVLQTNSNATHYVVAVGMMPSAVRFTVPAIELRDSSLFDVVNQRLQASNDWLTFERRGWAKQSFQMAMQFSNPQTIIQADRVGWSETQRRFQFPQFSILRNGQIDPTPMLDFDEGFPFPAAELTPPGPFREAITLLSRQSSETQLIWAMAACVAHNLLAGHFVREPLGILLDGRFAQVVGTKVATCLGCVTVDANRRRKQSIIEFVLGQCGRHSFPSLITFPPKGRVKFGPDWLDDPRTRRGIFTLPSPGSIAVATHPGFVRIRSHEFPQPLDRLSAAASWIIPSYLQDLCRRANLVNLSDGDLELIRVLQDMAEWLEKLGGNPKTVLAGAGLYRFDSESLGLAMAELIDQMYRGGQIGYALAGTESILPADQPLVVVEYRGTESTPPAILIRQWLLNETLLRRGLPPIRTEGVRADLRTRTALLRTALESAGNVWLIDTASWEKILDVVRRGQQTIDGDEEALLGNDGLWKSTIVAH